MNWKTDHCGITVILEFGTAPLRRGVLVAHVIETAYGITSDIRSESFFNITYFGMYYGMTLIAISRGNLDLLRDLGAMKGSAEPGWGGCTPQFPSLYL